MEFHTLISDSFDRLVTSDRRSVKVNFSGMPERFPLSVTLANVHGDYTLDRIISENRLGPQFARIHHLQGSGFAHRGEHVETAQRKRLAI